MRKIALITMMLVQYVFAQSNSANNEQYVKSLQARVDKILSPMALNPGKKFQKVHQLIVSQYQGLAQLHSKRDEATKALKSSHPANKETLVSLMAEVESNSTQKISKMHAIFLRRLGRLLNPAQVDAVKDGMTYHVATNTYKGYQEMLPTLTGLQKEKIWNWLMEAREIAMDAETSEKKHWWFGKYKGRINNYLSAEGYDMKKASEAWQKTTKTKTGKTVN